MMMQLCRAGCERRKGGEWCRQKKKETPQHYFFSPLEEKKEQEGGLTPIVTSKWICQRKHAERHTL